MHVHRRGFLYCFTLEIQEVIVPESTSVGVKVLEPLAYVLPLAIGALGNPCFTETVIVCLDFAIFFPTFHLPKRVIGEM